eukprot:1132274-Prorocentrum_lima.AAC.1
MNPRNTTTQKFGLIHRNIHWLLNTTARANLTLLHRLLQIATCRLHLSGCPALLKCGAQRLPGVPRMD